MTRKVDKLRVARALKALDEHAREHPEAFDRIELLGTPTGLSAALRKTGRPPSDDPTVAIGVRLPRSMVAAVEAAKGDLTMGAVVRLALTKWLRAQQRRHGRTDD